MGVITSFAPLVKRVMPTVVNVAVVQDVKVGAMQGEPEEGGGGPEEGGPEAGPPGEPQDLPGMPPAAAVAIPSSSSGASSGSSRMITSSTA